MDVNKIYQGNCLDILKTFPDDFIDFIITDPPYMVSQNKKIHRSNNTKFKGKDINLNFGDWDIQWKSKEEHIEWCFAWLKECIRILKPYRHLVFFFDKAWVTPVWNFLEANGMKGRQLLLWIKSNPAPRARKVSFVEAIEIAFWFTKGEVKQNFFNWKLGHSPNYVVSAIPNNPRLHPTQKAEKPIERWMEYLTNKNDIVLDPFAGSGTTLVVAKKLGRNYIGIEMNSEYVKIAEKRIAGTLVNETLFDVE